MLKYFYMPLIILNIINIILFTVGKMEYKKGNNTKFIAKLSIIISSVFLAYTILMFGLAFELISKNATIFGFFAFVMAISPFFIGKIATYKKADFYINWQIIAFAVNLVILVLFLFLTH